MYLLSAQFSRAGRMLSISACLAALAVTSWSTSAISQDREMLLRKGGIGRSLEYTPQAICIAMIRSFALKNQNLSVAETFERHGDDCGDHIRPGLYQDENWFINTTRVDGVIDEVDITLAGPFDQMSRNALRGYEFYTFRVMVIFDSSLNFAPYLYYRTSKYNLRSLTELVKENHRDNILMDPYESWTKNLLPTLNSAIADVAAYQRASAHTPLEREQDDLD